MAKKQIVPAVPPEPAPAEAPEKELIEGQWIVSEWRGVEQHTCSICQRDTLDGIKAARAMKAVCLRCGPPPAPRSTASVLVSDRWGNPVEPQE